MLFSRYCFLLYQIFRILRKQLVHSLLIISIVCTKIQYFFFQRPKTNDALCKECFFWAFETEVHHTITTTQMFQPGQLVAIAASGGKDSTVLAYIMKHLNEKYNYGLNLVLLSIDEGITGKGILNKTFQGFYF